MSETIEFLQRRVEALELENAKLKKTNELLTEKLAENEKSTN